VTNKGQELMDGSIGDVMMKPPPLHVPKKPPKTPN